MSTEVSKVQETGLAVADQLPMDEILKGDVLIPKLLLMQGLSDLVADRKAQQGDIVRSTSAEKVGDPDKAVEFIPLVLKNEWTLMEEINGKYEYRSTEPRTSKNEDQPWEFTQNGAPWKRVKVITCFALLLDDVNAEAKEIEKFKKTGEMPDLNKTLLPVAISFRSTSYVAGKGVSTHFAKAAAMTRFGVKPHAFSLMLSCKQEKNDKGNYFVFGVSQGKKVDAAAFDIADAWVNRLRTQTVRVDEGADVETHQPSGSREVASDSQY